MPIVRKREGALPGTTPDAKPQEKVSRLKAAKLVVELPEKLSEPKPNFSDYITLIYGEKKIGKTSLAACFPDTLFMMCEPGGKSLRIHQQPIRTWLEFIATVDALEGDTRFATVVVDTVDVAYDLCFDYMCKKLAIVHPHDENDYGKSWGMIRKEFERQFNRLFLLDKGAIMLSHSHWEEIRTRRGESYFRLTPTMSNAANGFLTAVVDIWGCYTYLERDRYLILKGDEHVSAGCRLEEQFMAVTGDPVMAVPMGDSARRAYANLMTAYHNKQATTGEEVLDPAKLPQPKRKRV